MALPPVGVTLVANDSEGFQRALASASAAVDNFTKSIANSGAPAMDKLAKATSTTTQVVNGFGSGLKVAQGVLSGLGSVAGSVVNTMGAVFDRVFTSVIRVVVRDAIREIQNFISSTAAAAIKGTELETDLGRLGASFDAVAKTSFAPLVGQLSSLVEKAAPGFLGIVQAAETWLGGLGSNALVWGGNVVNQFAQGMWNAIGSVLDALSGIANAVTYWLSPGSPPRLLPDIDKWGTAAANEFFGGWGKADFSIFSDLSSTITNLIRSLPISKGDQAGVIPNILGAREGIAAAVDELRATGTIAAATIDKITAAVGTSDASVRAYLESMVRLQAANQGVKDAQDNLNAVTKTYDDLLKPVDAAIAGITEAQAELADQQKKSLLQLVLKDPNATPNEKRAAQLELEKIDAEQRRRLLVADQKTAVDAATAKLDAAKKVQSQAQDEFDARKAQIQLISDQNSLLKEQLQLLERLAAAAGGAGPAKATKAGGAATPKPFAIEPFDLSKLIPPGILEKWQTFVAALQTAWAKIAPMFQPTIDAIKKHLIPAFDDLRRAVDEHMPDIESAIGKFVAFTSVELGTILGPSLVRNMSRIIEDLADIWRNHGKTIIGAVEKIFELIVADVAIWMNTAVAIFSLALNSLATALDVGSLLLQAKWQEALDRWLAGIHQFWDTLIGPGGLFETNFNLLLNVFGTNLATLKKKWDDAWDGVKKTITDIDWAAIGTGIIDGIKWGITSGLAELEQAAANAALAAFKAAKDALGIHSPSAAFMDVGKNIMTGMTLGIQRETETTLAAMRGAVGQMLPGSGSIWGGQVHAPLTAGQAISYSYSYATQGPSFTYAPTYASAPSSVSDNFATMSALWA